MDGPIPLSSGSPSPEPPKRRRGVFRKTLRGARWLLGGGSDWAGVTSIRRGATLINDLVHVSRSETSARERVFVDEDRTLDLRATAFSQGITEDALVRRLEERRRQTARIAYGTFALACLFLIGWVHAALDTPLSTVPHYAGGRFPAVLRAVLFDRVLQCADQLPDPVGPSRHLARISPHRSRVLAAVIYRRSP